MKDRRWITIAGFLTAITWSVLMLILYIHAHQYGGRMLLDTNYYGEWGVEIVLIAVSIPLLVYAMLDYIRMLDRSGGEG